MDFANLKGLSIVITGGGSGLGYKMAVALSALGANVSCLSLYCDNVVQPFSLYIGDIFDNGFVLESINEIISKQGTIDVLINNIGFGTNNRLESLELEEFKSMIDLNFIAQVEMISLIKKYTCLQKYLKIINISSTFARACIPTLAGYAASKAGSLQLTRELAKRSKDDRITYICVCPGYFEHKKHTEYFASQAGKNFVATRIPLKKVGKAELSLVPAIVILCSSNFKDTRYLELVIDGGVSAYV